LGIELVELTTGACCGAGVISEADPELALTINGRTFAQAERLGLNLLTICGTCQGVMARANRELCEDKELLEQVNSRLGDEGPYQGGVEIKHLLWALIDQYGLDNLKKRVKMPLRHLRIAPFYGCYILRPSENLGFDDPTNPVSLEKLIIALGGEPVEYAGRIKCCGFPVLLEREEIATAMAGENLKEAKQKGANLLVTPCPLCHMSLDIYQDRAARCVKTPLGIPILHLPQLVGLALGIPPGKLGLSRHMVSADSVVETIYLKSQRP
jgi:succinate dehydrogenase / fumarate reductase cytochrome b subunit